jgi:hypothetical protein
MFNKMPLSLYGNDIFVDGYFFKNGLGHNQTAADLNAAQPWLQWRPESQSFHLQRGNTKRKLLSNWFHEQAEDTVVIYRGLTQSREMLFLKLFKKMADPNSPGSGQDFARDWKAAFEAWYRDILIGTQDPKIAQDFQDQVQAQVETFATQLQDLSPSSPSQSVQTLLKQAQEIVYQAGVVSGRGAMFFSNDWMTSSRWAGKAGKTLITVQISKAQLMALADRNDIYVGIEGNAFEFALESQAVQNYVWENWQEQNLAPHWNPRSR